MEADKKQYYGQLNNEYLSNGNAAVKVKDYRDMGNAAPAYEPLPAVTEPRRKEDRRTDDNRKTKTRKTFKPKAEQNISLGSLVFLMAAIAITLFTCYDYLKVQGQTVLVEKEIRQLESELEAVSARNDVAYNDVIEAVDFDYVYTVAVRDLNMVFPNNNTTVNYSRENSGYVRQFSDIPELEKLNAIKSFLP